METPPRSTSKLMVSSDGAPASATSPPPSTPMTSSDGAPPPATSPPPPSTPMPSSDGSTPTPSSLPPPTTPSSDSDGDGSLPTRTSLPRPSTPAAAGGVTIAVDGGEASVAKSSSPPSSSPSPSPPSVQDRSTSPLPARNLLAQEASLSHQSASPSAQFNTHQHRDSSSRALFNPMNAQPVVAALGDAGAEMERNAQHTRTEASAPIPGLNPHLTEATDAKGSEACWAEAKTIPDIDTGGKAKAKSDSDSPINADKRGKEAMLLESEQQVNTNNRPDTARGEARRRAMMMLAAAIKEEENEEMVLKAITEEVEKTNARAEATRKACMEANVRARAAMEKEAAVKMILNENMEEEENANMKLKEIAEEGAKACKRAQAAKEACMAAQQRTKAAMEEEVEANKMLKKSMEAETNAKAKADIIRREADEARKRAQTTFQEEYEDSRRARTTRKDQEASIKSKEDLFYQGKGTCSIKGKESGSWDEGARLKLNAEMRTRGTMRTNARSDIEMGERTHDRDDDMPDFDPNGDPDVSKKLERRDRGSRTCRLGILTGMLLMFHCALIFLTYAFMTMPSKTECKEISTSNIWFEGCLWLGLLAVHTYFKYILDTCYNFQPDGRSEGAHVFLHTFSRVIFVGVLHTPMAGIRKPMVPVFVAHAVAFCIEVLGSFVLQEYFKVGVDTGLPEIA